MARAVITALWVGTAALLPGHAALLCYEGFEQAAAEAPLAGLSDGAGWDGGWLDIGSGAGGSLNADSLAAGVNAPTGYDARSLGHSALLKNGNRFGRFLDRSAGGTFGSSGYVDGNGHIGADGMTLYISFLQQASGTGKFYEFEFHRDNLGDPGRMGGVGNDTDATDTHFRAPNGVMSSLGAGDTGVNLYVLKIVFNEGDDDVYVYRNPIGASEGENAPVLELFAAGDMSFDGVSLAAYLNGIDVTHDEIRMGQAWSDVVAIGGAPSFTTQPLSQTAYVHGSVTFVVAATSDQAPQYQWYRDNTPLAGATSPTLSLPRVEPSDAGNYWASASNTVGSVSSVTATLTVVPLMITRQPQSQSIYLNRSNPPIVLVADVLGAPPVAYQWYLNGVVLAGATNTSLALSVASTADAGDYSLVAANAFGSITSSVAAVTVYLRDNCLFAYEGFDYPLDNGTDPVPVDALDGGLGWKGPWSFIANTFVYVVPGNLLGDANAPAGYDARSVGNSLEDYGTSRAGRSLDCSVNGSLAKHGFIDKAGNIGADGKTVYLSFLQRTLTTSSFYEFEFHRGDLGDPGRMGGVGNDNGSGDVNLRDAKGRQTAIGVADTVANLYVVRIDYKAGSDDVFVYRNPTSASEPAAATLVVQDAGDMSFSGLSVGTWGNDVTHDEIRIGATWEDAIGVAVSNLLPVKKAGDGWKVSFACTPGRSYRLQHAAEISGPWTTVATLTGPDSGLLEFVDTASNPARSFYRTVTD